MELGNVLRLLRLLQIIVVTFISFVMSVSFLKISGPPEDPNVKKIQENAINSKMFNFYTQVIGILALFFFCLLILQLALECLKSSWNFKCHVMSGAIAVFLNFFGITLACSLTHVIALWPHLFNASLVYFGIGSIYVSLMIENFVQGRKYVQANQENNGFGLFSVSGPKNRRISAVGKNLAVRH